MAGANTQVNLVGLDFDTIKNNLKTYLQSQDVFKDYNFEGSGLSTLLDVLAYNTQYNSYYLNMVANEMFMDTALQRSSVISHAKLLNYTPRSAKSARALIDLSVSPVAGPSITLPAMTNFMSESVDNINYNFFTTNTTEAVVTANTALFTDIELKQGIPVSQRFFVDSAVNPTYTFELPDSNIDTDFLTVKIQKSSSNNYFEVYTLTNDFLSLTNESKVFFLQESLNGNYEISFGDGILGKKLEDGNWVNVTYVTTESNASYGANNFVLMDPLPYINAARVIPKAKSAGGLEKEDLDSIKKQAPKTYSAQNRAVSKDDYITAIYQNKSGLTFDAVNVWGGESNDPPVYGQVFVSLKPTGTYSLTDTQKQKLINEVIKPMSVLTVTPTIVDPDYVYLQLVINVYYDPSKTNLNATQIASGIKSVVANFAQSTLNTFNSTFLEDELTYAIKTSNQSVITSEVQVSVQKKFYPNLNAPTTYSLYYGTELQRGILLSGVSSSPTMQFRDPQNLSTIVTGVKIEEVPETTYGVESLNIVNPGFSYKYAPTVTIEGDGYGATAEATINSQGQIKTITVTNPGNNYTSAIAKITPLSNDNTGQSGAATVNLTGRYGKLRLYYNNDQKVKVIYDENTGTIDYTNGVITLDSFNPIDVDDDFGQLTITSKPVSTIISSAQNRIITLNTDDPTSIIINVIAKK